MQIDDIEQEKLEDAWSMGDYTDRECRNCGRNRVRKCQNGKTRCEKCNWIKEDNQYCDLAV